MGSHCWNLWFSCSSRHVPKLSYDLHAAALATCCRLAQVWFSLACSKMSAQPHFQPSWRSTSAHSELNLNFSDARVLKSQLFRVITTKLQKDYRDVDLGVDIQILESSHLLHRNRSGASWVYSYSCQVGPKTRLALVSLECVWLRAMKQEKIDQTEKCLVEETSVIKKILKEDFWSKEEID